MQTFFPSDPMQISQDFQFGMFFLPVFCIKFKAHCKAPQEFMKEDQSGDDREQPYRNAIADRR